MTALPVSDLPIGGSVVWYVVRCIPGWMNRGKSDFVGRRSATLNYLKKFWLWVIFGFRVLYHVIVVKTILQVKKKRSFFEDRKGGTLCWVTFFPFIFLHILCLYPQKTLMACLPRKGRRDRKIHEWIMLVSPWSKSCGFRFTAFSFFGCAFFDWNSERDWKFSTIFNFSPQKLKTWTIIKYQIKKGEI